MQLPGAGKGPEAPSNNISHLNANDDAVSSGNLMTTLKKKPVIGSEVFYKQISCSGECLICMEMKEVAFVIAPCGHDGICQKCLEDIKGSNNPLCPICNTKIENYYRHYTTRQKKEERQYVFLSSDLATDRKLIESLKKSNT